VLIQFLNVPPPLVLIVALGYYHRLPPFPAGGAVQQELSLSALLEGRQLEEFTEAHGRESSSLPSPGNSRDTKIDEAIIEWEEEEEGEDDGTGESPKHPPRLFIPNHTAWCGVPLAPPFICPLPSGVTVPRELLGKEHNSLLAPPPPASPHYRRDLLLNNNHPTFCLCQGRTLGASQRIVSLVSQF
jgi:hypothetical protein